MARHIRELETIVVAGVSTPVTTLVTSVITFDPSSAVLRFKKNWYGRAM